MSALDGKITIERELRPCIVHIPEKLIRLCEKYHDDMDIDIMHGRTVVDGCSLLGVTSLIGHFVTVKPNGKDENAVQRFADELERIKC